MSLLVLACLASPLLAGSRSVTAQTLNAQALDRVAGWRSDVDYLVAEAQRLNPGPTRPAFSEPFLEAAAEIRAAIPQLTDDQVLARLMRLTALLGDGHSALYGPGADGPLQLEARILPLKFYLFPEGLAIVGGVGPAADLAGSLVLRFGDLAAGEVLARMSAYRGVDNAMSWNWMGPQFYLGSLLLLSEVGVPVEDGAVSITVLSPEGEEHTLKIAGGTERPLRKLRTFVGSPTQPLYLTNVAVNYWMRPLPEHDALYVQFNQVRDAAESLDRFSGRVRETLLDSGARVLIVDVRHNNGGNNTLVRPLVRVMVEFEMRDPGNRVFVLMGRNTFSAAQNFINRVERWTDATFAGEPSSSCPNFVGEDNEIALPFSRVRGSLSNLYWQDSDPWDDRAWIEPDLPVELTLEDYLAGRNPVLERVLAEL
jgi:hypothetical protein